MDSRQDRVDNYFIGFSTELKMIIQKTRYINEKNLTPSFDICKDLANLSTEIQTLISRLKENPHDFDIVETEIKKP